MKKVLVSIFLFLLLYLSWSKVLDNQALSFNKETTKDVVITLAITRSINAALSVVQNSSLLLGVGVQVDMAIGEVVNPINDFLDRFSWILLFSLISLGIQNIFISLITTPFFNTILTLLVIGVIVSLYKNFIYQNILYKIVVLLFFVRLAIPFIDTLNGYIYNNMMKTQIVEIEKENRKFDKELQSLLPSDYKTEEIDKKISKLEKVKKNILEEVSQNMNYFEKLKVKFSYDSLSDKNKLELINIDSKIELLQKQKEKLRTNPIDKIKLFIEKVKYNMDSFFIRSYHSIILFLTRGIIFPLIFLFLLIRIGKELVYSKGVV